MKICCSIAAGGWIRIDVEASTRDRFDHIIKALKTHIPVLIFDRRLRRFKTTVHDYRALMSLCSEHQIEMHITKRLSRLYNWYRVFNVRSEVVDLDMSLWTDDPALQPKEHQLHGAKKLVHFRRFILADDMGVGKTVQAMLLMTHVTAQCKNVRTLVVAPKRLLRQWKNEILKFTKIPESSVKIFGESDWVCRTGEMKNLNKRSNVCKHCKHFNSCTHEKQMSNEQIRLNQIYNANILIINYDMIYRHKNEIIRNGFRIMILDEASRIKNYQTGIAKGVNAVAESMKKNCFICLMSGTIIENKMEELFSAVNVVDPKIFGSFWSFRERYVITDHFGKCVAYTNKKEVKRKIENIYIRRTLDEVWSDRPELWIDNRTCEMSPFQKSMYDDCRRGILDKIKDIERARRINALDIAPLMQVLLTVCGTTKAIDPDTDNKGHSTKIEMLKMIIQDCADDNSILVFSRFSEKCIPHIINDINGLGREVYKITGKTKSADADRILCELEQKPGSILVAGDSIAYGMNLQFINHMVNFDLQWNPAVLHQRIRRLFRPGQKKNVSIVNLIVENTIEQRVYDCVLSKQVLFSEIFKVSGDLEPLMPSADTMLEYIKSI